MSKNPLDYGLNSPMNARDFSFSSFFKDVPLFFSVTAVVIFGFFMLYSASGQSVVMTLRQIIFGLSGLVIMLSVGNIQPRVYKNLILSFFWLSLILLIVVLILPSTDHPTRRWIDLGIISFQPSEIVRLILPLAIAVFLTRKQMNPSLIEWTIAILAIIVSSFLISIQPDLGTALIVLVSGFIPIFLAGFPLSVFLVFLLVLLATSPFLWNSLQGYQQERILTFLNPESDPLGSGWNIAQSKMAVGSGGYFGKGYLSGTQSQLNFLPESHSDFIFAVIGEELGLVGIILLLLFYCIILLRVFKIASEAENEFSRLVCSSIGFIFLIYILVNISMVVGIFPVVGVPLPLVSQGGTSLIIHLLALGIVLSLKRRETW